MPSQSPKKPIEPQEARRVGLGCLIVIALSIALGLLFVPKIAGWVGSPAAGFDELKHPVGSPESRRPESFLIRWHTDLAAARAQADREGKPILVHAGGADSELKLYEELPAELLKHFVYARWLAGTPRPEWMPDFLSAAADDARLAVLKSSGEPLLKVALAPRTISDVQALLQAALDANPTLSKSN